MVNIFHKSFNVWDKCDKQRTSYRIRNDRDRGKWKHCCYQLGQTSVQFNANRERRRGFGKMHDCVLHGMSSGDTPSSKWTHSMNYLIFFRTRILAQSSVHKTHASSPFILLTVKIQRIPSVPVLLLFHHFVRRNSLKIVIECWHISGRISLKRYACVAVYHDGNMWLASEMNRKRWSVCVLCTTKTRECALGICLQIENWST